ncbi:MAG: ATP-binding cassette domain-containing protein [Janthinobacterium lividum]
MARSTRPVRRIEPRPETEVDDADWPDSIPAVRQLLTKGFDLPGGVTFLVGENGAGKSTVLEGIAEALEVHAEGGLRRHAGAHRDEVPDSSGLGNRLHVVRSAGAAREVFFLRAETMHRFYSYLHDVGSPAHGQLHQRSHGESFLDVVEASWMRTVGVVLLDEPESALSFENCLLLAASFATMAKEGKQILCATHSPLLTALPGAHVLQVDEQGITPVDWEDLGIVRNWRFFLDAPQRFWRHVL